MVREAGFQASEVCFEVIWPERAVLRPVRDDFWSVRRDFRTDFRLLRLEFRPEKVGFGI